MTWESGPPSAIGVLVLIVGEVLVFTFGRAIRLPRVLYRVWIVASSAAVWITVVMDSRATLEMVLVAGLVLIVLTKQRWETNQPCRTCGTWFSSAHSNGACRYCHARQSPTSPMPDDE